MIAETEPYFNLIDEPWIPVLRTDGTQGHASLVSVFEDADKIQQLMGELPTMRPALLRIFIAILTRAVGHPRDARHWLEQLDDWEAVVERVRGYLAEHRERFWLRHPTEPFFQVADLGPESGDTKGLGAIVADFPSNVQFFTQRGPDSLARMEPGEAARWLIHTQAYDSSGIKSPDRRDPRMKGGKVYPLGTAWGGKGEILIASGPDLRTTLMLHHLAPDAVGARSGPDDLPPWERPHPGPVEEFSSPAEPAGYLQVYTWQARRVRLVFDGTAVTRVVLTYGDPLAEPNRQHLDPMMTWRYSRPQTKKAGTTVFMPGIVDSAKGAWRGFAAWLPTTAQTRTDGQPSHLEPGMLRWVGQLHRRDALPLGFQPDLTVFGVEYGPQSATFTEIVDDSLLVPTFLLDEDAVDAAVLVREAIDDADTTAWYLGTFAANLTKARGVDEVDTPRREAREDAYLEFGRLFERWLSTLTDGSALLSARRSWQHTLKSVALQLAHARADAAGELTYIGRVIDPEYGTWLNAEIALSHLHRGLAKTLPLAHTKETDTHAL